MLMKSVLHCFIVILLAGTSLKSIAQKTSGFEPRLVKELRRAYNSSGFFSAKDSAMYTYSGDRAWDSVKNDWKYEMRTDGTNRTVRTFDQSNRISIEDYQKFDAGFWWPDKRMLFEYQNNKVVKMTYQEWQSGAWVNLVRYDYSYDAGGNKVVDLTMVWETSGWQNSTRLVFTYSSTGVEEVLHERWVQNAWEAQAIESFAYANGKKSGRVFKVAQGGWPTVQEDFFFYNSKGDDSMQVFTTLDNNNLFDTMKYSYHYNGSNRQDTILLQRVVNGTDSNISKTLLLYDAYGLLGLKNIKYWNDVTKQWYYPLGIVEYLYEYEQVKVSVKDLVHERSEIVLYPVPARGNDLMLHLHGVDMRVAQLRIYTMAGKLVHTKKIAGVQNNRLRLDIAELQSGNYMLIIEGSRGRVSRLFSVER